MRCSSFQTSVQLTFTAAAILTVFSVSLRAEEAAVASIKPNELVGYANQPPKVRQLIDHALGLTRKNLGYRYGSNSPAKGGMDCSGTVQHTLSKAGVSIPRSSRTIFLWAREVGTLKRLPAGVRDISHESLKDLKPGDLIFWEGTYATGKRQPPISHVMIYLGKLKADGKPVIFGASSGRRYRGKKIHGVSVFDFKFPAAGSRAKLVAIARVPGLR